MTPAPSLTAPQREWLSRADHRGLIERRGAPGIMEANWHRMMGRLVDAGLVTPYRHGGYEITGLGRALISPPAPPEDEPGA